MNGIFPDFFCEEEAGGDVDEFVAIGDHFSKCGSATERCSDDNDLSADPRRRLKSLEGECFL